MSIRTAYDPVRFHEMCARRQVHYFLGLMAFGEAVDVPARIGAMRAGYIADNAPEDAVRRLDRVEELLLRPDQTPARSEDTA